jgi:hypothetical protein
MKNKYVETKEYTDLCNAIETVVKDFDAQNKYIILIFPKDATIGDIIEDFNK